MIRSAARNVAVSVNRCRPRTLSSAYVDACGVRAPDGAPLSPTWTLMDGCIARQDVTIRFRKFLVSTPARPTLSEQPTRGRRSSPRQPAARHDQAPRSGGSTSPNALPGSAGRTFRRPARPGPRRRPSSPTGTLGSAQAETLSQPFSPRGARDRVVRTRYPRICPARRRVGARCATCPTSGPAHFPGQERRVNITLVAQQWLCKGVGCRSR